ncbi:MAG: ParB/RepB/Spo0J family partition protein [Breznakia sp.]
MSEVKKVKIKDIQMNPHQPRIHFDVQALQALMISIKENGLVQPITLRSIADHYELIAGERRLRACQQLQYESIPAYIISSDEESSMYMALIENIQREDLSAIEEARAYHKIMDMRHLTQKEFAYRIGKSQSSVANKLRLLQLSENVQNAIESKIIHERHARAMVGLSEIEQARILKQIVQDDLTVKETEAIVKPKKQKPKRNSKGYSKNIQLGINTIHQAVELANRSGMKSSIEQKENEEEVIIEIHIQK